MDNGHGEEENAFFAIDDASADGTQLDTTSEQAEQPANESELPPAFDLDGASSEEPVLPTDPSVDVRGQADEDASLDVLPPAHAEPESPPVAKSAAVEAPLPATSETAAVPAMTVEAATAGGAVSANAQPTAVSAAASGLAHRALRESRAELGAESLLEAFSAKAQLVRVPTELVRATDSEARALTGLPPLPREPTVLDKIWGESVEYHDVRSVLSRIWERDDTALHSVLSDIWAQPAVRSALSDIWEEAVQLVEPKSVLSDIWTEPPVHVDTRSVLSQIWSEDNRQRVMSVLSEIWSTPTVRSILSEIWGSDALRSVLSEIWSTPVERVDIRRVLSQIWSKDLDEPPPRSVLSEIWATPAVQGVLSQIWGSPKLRSILWQIWQEPVEKVDIRSVLSQIWSSDNDDERARSILSEIWATPAVRSVLSKIWRAEEAAPVVETRADYRVTESEMLLEELMENLQKSEADVASAASRPDGAAEEALGEEEREEQSRRRVHRYAGAADEGDLPASRPLTTRWAFGGSCKAPVINLTGEKSKLMVYGAGQCAIIYDYANNTQKILQGHRNCVCGLAASSNGRWIASGDIGPDNALIVWDAAASAPLQMYFPSAPFSGPLALQFSCDSRYVVGLWGAVCGGGDDSSGPARARQQLIIWDWTVDDAVPKVVHQVGAGHGFHHHVAVSQLDPAVMAITASCRVMFFQLTESGVGHHCPQLHNTYSPDFKCSPGHFSQTAFSSDDPYSAVTGTDKGYMVLWSDRRPSAPCDPAKLTPTVKKEARKVLKISEAAITCVQIIDGLVCAGTAAGELRFLDGQLRLRQWYQRFGLAAVRCLSFGLQPVRPVHRGPSDRDAAAGGDSADSRRTADSAAAQAEEETPFPGDASLEAVEFACRDLLVTTVDGFCGLVQVHTSSCRRLAQFPVVTVRALDVHTARPHLVIGAYDGTVRVYDFERKQLVHETVLTGNSRVHSVAFSPSGLHLAVGMQCGDLALLDGLTLRPQCDRFSLSRAAVTQCLFSPDSDLLATRDDDLVVSVYRFLVDTHQWAVLARYRAHYKPIVQLLFVPGQDQPAPPRLLSLGEDRVLVEYDLVNSTKESPVILCCDILEQSAVPLCMALYPPLTTENFILVANSQYKMKLFNAHTRMCRHVVLGPQFGSPVERIKVIPRILSCDTGLAEEQHSYMAFSTSGRIGLQVLPLDGNPRKAAAVIGHPTKVEQLDCSADGRWLFSAGGEDGCVFMWEIYPESLEAMSMLGGTGMAPFYDQLEGGRDGELYRRLEDLVYYTQLVCQGEDVLDERAVSQRIPLHTVTDVLRAIGFYPTDKETEDMQNEVRYREYAATGELVEEVHLDDIIRLYINHRPVMDLSRHQLDWALNTLAQTGRRHHGHGLSRKELLRALQAKGEHMSGRELAGALAELLDPEAHTLPQGVPLETVEHQLPKVMTVQSLCSELLAMPELLMQDGAASPTSRCSPDDPAGYRSAAQQ